MQIFLFFKNKFIDENNKEKEVKSLFKIFNGKKEELATENIWELRPKSSKTKTNFAFALMTFDENFTNLKWKVPKYIEEGLVWLANNEIAK